MLKQRKRRKNPTKKDNLIGYIIAGSKDIFERSQNREIQEGLQRATEEDLRHLAKLIDNLDQWIIHTAGMTRMRLQ